LPFDPENYVHRIGRTGRMGKDGIAIAFVTPEQGQQLTDIESFINTIIPEDRHEDYQDFRPIRKVPEKQEPKEYVPVFGRRQKRYSRRL
jgi:ATP-dependent RNA helicase DeaD